MQPRIPGTPRWCLGELSTDGRGTFRGEIVESRTQGRLNHRDGPGTALVYFLWQGKVKRCTSLASPKALRCRGRSPRENFPVLWLINLKITD